MRAKITLQSALTYTRGGRTFKRGKPVITGNAEEIAFAENTTGFHVVMLGRPPKTKAKPESAPAPKSKSKSEAASAPSVEAKASGEEEAAPPAKASRPKRGRSKAAKSAGEE